MMILILFGVIASAERKNQAGDLKKSCFLDLESEDTLCIEICTDHCIKEVDVYKCFDVCTLQKCMYDSKNINKTEKASGYGIITYFVIFAAFIFITIKYHRQNLKNNDNYWPL